MVTKFIGLRALFGCGGVDALRVRNYRRERSDLQSEVVTIALVASSLNSWVRMKPSNRLIKWSSRWYVLLDDEHVQR